MNVSKIIVVLIVFFGLCFLAHEVVAKRMENALRKENAALTEENRSLKMNTEVYNYVIGLVPEDIRKNLVIPVKKGWGITDEKAAFYLQVKLEKTDKDKEVEK